jgi:hypothetical protein
MREEADADEPQHLLFAWRQAIAVSDLTSTQRHVALQLSNHMDMRGGSCWPSVALLASETALGGSTVRKAIYVLDAAGYLSREPGKGRGHSTRYQATLPETCSAANTFKGRKSVRKRNLKVFPQGHQALQEHNGGTLNGAPPTKTILRSDCCNAPVIDDGGHMCAQCLQPLGVMA